MIYLYQLQTRIINHTDKVFAEDVLKLGEPLATLTEQEWSDCNGLARMIDGILVLGQTDAEIQTEQIALDAEVAQKQLDATDYDIIKKAEAYLVNLGLAESREPLRDLVRLAE